MTDAGFREAYGQHKDMLYRFARAMTGSAAIAENLVHDCFLMFGGAQCRSIASAARCETF